MATSQTPPSETDQIEQQISEIRSDISDLTRLLASLAETKADEVKAAAKDEANQLFRRTSEMAGAAQDKTREATETLENHIKEKPLQSALIALMIGLVFGALSRR